MEFFETVAVNTNEKQIQEKLNFNTLEELNEEMFFLEGINDYECKVGTIWGEFTLLRHNINGGVRFALSDCPNALAWTITTGFPPEREAVVLHLTINRTRKPAEFIEEIDEFIEAQQKGLKQIFK